MDRRLFLFGSSSLLALASGRQVLAQQCPIQNWNNFNVTRDASGAVLHKEMFGVNLLAPFDDISGNFGTRLTNYSGGIAPEDTPGVGPGVVRWPGGGLTEGSLQNGEWVSQTGVNFGDLDTSGGFGQGDIGQWRGKVGGSGIERDWLQTSLDEFLSYLHENPHVKGIIVLPTIRYLRPHSHPYDRIIYRYITRSSAQDGKWTLRMFVEHVYDRIANSFPSAKIFAWEIGNEYVAKSMPDQTAAMSATEYGHIAEAAVRAVRAANPQAKVGIQCGPLKYNWTNFSAEATELHTAFTDRASDNNTSMPDYIVHHIYEGWVLNDPGTVDNWDSEHDAERLILDQLQALWSGIPMIVSEWNLAAQTYPNVAAYNNANNASFRIGAETGYRLAAMLDTMVGANVKAACFWPFIHDWDMTSMYGYGATTPLYAASAMKWLLGIWGGDEQDDSTDNSKAMRRATVVNENAAGSAIRVFAYCKHNRKRAKILIFSNNAVAQNIKIRIHGMRTPSNFSARRLRGPSGPIDLAVSGNRIQDANLRPVASFDWNIGCVTRTTFNGVPQYEVPIAQGPAPSGYEMILLTANFT